MTYTKKQWEKIQGEYVTSNISYRNLAKKYSVKASTLTERARREGWSAQRKDIPNRVVENIVQKSVQKKINKTVQRYSENIVDITDITDKLMWKIDKAIDELDIVTVVNTIKKQSTEYDNDDVGNITPIHIEETIHSIETVNSLIDKSGIKQLTSALKDLKEIKMIKSVLDIKEQEARIRALENQIEEIDKGIIVEFKSAEEYTK